MQDLTRERISGRFFAKVRHEGDHQVWTGAMSKGLGLFKLDGYPEKAPRVAWLLEHSELPARPLERLCDMPGCVNPAHHRERGSATATTGSPPRRRGTPTGGSRRRRSRGEGHIRQRSPGSFTIEVITGHDPLNPRRRFRQTFTVRGSVEDAQAKLAEFQASARLGDRINEAATGTFAELLDRWLEHAKLEESTRTTYRGYIDNQIKPALGHLPLRELTTFVFDRFYTELAKRGGKCRHCWWRIRNGQAPLGPNTEYKPSPKAATKPHLTDCVTGLPLAPATQRHIHAIIHRALQQAKKWKLITVNPASDTDRVAVPEPALQVPTSQVVATVLGAAYEEEAAFGLFVWMLLITGGRRGEACGIRWTSVDASRATLTISQVVEGGGTAKPYPKNRKHRRIRLDPLTLSLLEAEHTVQEQLAKDAGLHLRDDGYLFAHPTTPDGSRPCDPDYLSKRFRRLCEQFGVKLDRNLYALRHFAGTDLARWGVDIRTIAGRLGNDPVVALRRYIHFVGEADQQAVAGLSARLQDALAETGTAITPKPTGTIEDRQRRRRPRGARAGGWGWPGTPLLPAALQARWGDRAVPSAVCRALGLPDATRCSHASFPDAATPATAGRAVTTMAPWFTAPEIARLPLVSASPTPSDIATAPWQGRTKALLTRIARQHPGGLPAWLATATIEDLLAVRSVGPATILDTMIGLEPRGE